MRELLEGVRARDASALESFFDHYFGRVYALVLRMVGDRDAAEDVTQDVFHRVHKAADRLDPHRDPGPWLTAIACNSCRKYWRSKAYRLTRRTASLDDDPVAERKMPVVSGDPESEYLDAESATHVREAVAQLPNDLREAVVLHAFEGKGHEEIAALTGISHAAARKRYSRALAELKRLLQSFVGGVQ